MNRTAASLLLFCATFLVAPWSASAVTINTVYIGDVGNADNPTKHIGGVSYAYNIGRTEVTIGQYTEFLNAVGKTDTYGVYSSIQSTNFHAGRIARTGSPGNFHYATIDSPDIPVTFMSWGDAARFCNWLHNGQPVGLQDGSTTERGSYKLDGAVTTPVLTNVSRNAGATWVIPTDNEWYKAACYQPVATGGDVDGYWDYFTRTNSPHYSDQPPGLDAPAPSHTMNVFIDDGVDNGYDDGFAVSGSTSFFPGIRLNYLTPVGAYTQSSSYYGTFDQGGNASEWTEGRDLNTRQTRGGNLYSAGHILGTFNALVPTAVHQEGVGFRVALVPEPSSFVLAALGLIGLAAWGWRRKR